MSWPAQVEELEARLAEKRAQLERAVRDCERERNEQRVALAQTKLELERATNELSALSSSKAVLGAPTGRTHTHTLVSLLLGSRCSGL